MYVYGILCGTCPRASTGSLVRIAWGTVFIEGESETESEGGNKGRVGRDASILQRGRYVGIASRGSLSRTANYGIMHTAGPVPQL